MRVIIIRTNGNEETHDVAFDKIAPLIGASELDTVNIFKDSQARYSTGMRKPVMLVDGDGYETGSTNETIDDGVLQIHITAGAARKPVNKRATSLYHAICRPGTTHQIVGDVAIVDDEDCV